MTVDAPTAAVLADQAWQLTPVDSQRALVMAEAALERALAEDDPVTRARALKVRGRCEQQLGRLLDAAATLQEGVAVAAAAGTVRVQVECLIGLSHVYDQLADAASAVDVLQEALDLAQGEGDPQAVAGVLVNLAGARLEAGDATGAAEQARELLELDIDDPQLRICALGQLGRALAALGHLGSAVTEQAAAQRLAEEAGDEMLRMWTALALAEVQLSLARPGPAQEQACLALQLAEHVGGPRRPGRGLRAPGAGPCLHQRRHDEALDALRSALERAEAAGVPRLVADALDELAAVLHALGDHEEAYAALRRAFDAVKRAEREETDDRAQAALVRHRVSQVAAEADRLARENAALEQARQAAEELAAVDHLTGLASRRRGGEELARLTRRGSPFGLLVVDVDHFKQVNDTLGARAGDEVLVEIAGRLRAALRDGDVLARWGGEEFLVLLPGAPDADRVRLAAERLRVAVGSAPVATSGGQRRVTVSIGGAVGRHGRRPRCR
jgi:diguanylate cyclase (GGDEF)-like protein